MKELAVYIHIPFCDHKCIYCDFYSIITYDNKAAYLRMLINEIKNNADKFAENRIVTSLFFGGGTPSFMEPEYIAEIITSIQKYFHVDKNAEITLESNPGTVDKQKLKEFKDAGINRLSIGVQSFNDEELKFLTRIHNSETAKSTILAAAEAGFHNINIDLIFNLPNQTKKTWKQNLETAVKLPVTHISAYSLILERGTILNKMVLDGKVMMQDSDYDADLYEFTIDYLTKNSFYQYEVSNFCLPGFECKHNNAYWRYKEYLGFGTSAHSFVDGKRWWNYSSLTFYLEKMKSDSNPIAGFEKLTEKETHDEYVMLALRSKGLDLLDYKKRFDNSWLHENEKLLKQYESEGYLSMVDNFIKFTPKGFAVCDEILTKIL